MDSSKVKTPDCVFVSQVVGNAPKRGKRPATAVSLKMGDLELTPKKPKYSPISPNKLAPWSQFKIHNVPVRRQLTVWRDSTEV